MDKSYGIIPRIIEWYHIKRYNYYHNYFICQTLISYLLLLNESTYFSQLLTIRNEDNTVTNDDILSGVENSCYKESRIVAAKQCRYV